MKRTTLFVSILSAVALASATAHAAEVFTRAGADVTKFKAIGTADDFSDWEVGAFVEVGLNITDAHSVGLEVGYVKADGHWNFSEFDIEKKQVPILVNYRFTYAFGEAKIWSLSAGATVGVIHDKFTLDTPSPDSTGSDSNWLFTYGITAGISYSITKNWSFDLGGRILWVDNKEYKGIGDGDLTLSKDTTYARPSVNLSVTYRF
ncbi:hypothetical protein OPIT5_00265 (plasmid) [Opitutaceae bacterium TAV5]|nr:hypothetical protein OPIT5_00265 [Opitutaceae bacterium TAV5]